MLLIKNGNLYTMESEPLKGFDILIENGKIKEIGKKILANCETLDAKGMNVLPGLVDAHCHIGMWENGMDEEGADGNEFVNPSTPSLRAIDGINPRDEYFKEAREGGVTTVVTGPGSANVIGGQFCAMKTVGDRIDDMIIKAPCALKVAFGENPKRVYKEQKKSPITRMATAAILRKELIRAGEYMRKIEMAGDDGLKLPERDLDLDILCEVLRGNLIMKAHAHRADDILTAIRIAKEFNIRLSIEHCTEGHTITEYLKNGNVKIVLGPLATERCKIELRNLTLAAPGIMEKAGLEFALCTDHPVIMEQYLLLSAALAVREGLSEETALRCVTINAARAAGIDDRVGSIARGKDADLVLFGGNPLDIRNKPSCVIIDGKMVYSAIDSCIKKG
jgi:imidazolonepropionase-like amidohydrolase